MAILIIPEINQVFGNGTIFSGPMDFIFRNFHFFILSVALFNVPLFFSSRALYRFKEWGRIAVIVLLFFMMLFAVAYGYAFFSVKWTPLPFRFMSLVFTLVEVAAIGIPVYFLMRRSTKEGIKDYNQKKSEVTEQDTNQPMN